MPKANQMPEQAALINIDAKLAEAGYALGLGMPVVWCVREDELDDVHFDTRQFNHIVWRDPSELRQRLAERVAGVIDAD